VKEQTYLQMLQFLDKVDMYGKQMLVENGALAAENVLDNGFSSYGIATVGGGSAAAGTGADAKTPTCFFIKIIKIFILFLFFSKNRRCKEIL
jgi:hypothetical protein